jgi:hypothetical protein
MISRFEDFLYGERTAFDSRLLWRSPTDRTIKFESSNISTIKILHMSAKHQYRRTPNLPYLWARCELERTKKINKKNW